MCGNTSPCLCSYELIWSSSETHKKNQVHCFIIKNILNDASFCGWSVLTKTPFFIRCNFVGGRGGNGQGKKLQVGRKGRRQGETNI